MPREKEEDLSPLVAKMTDNMLEFAEEPKEIKILDEFGNPLLQGDKKRRLFEASWIYKYKKNSILPTK